MKPRWSSQLTLTGGLIWTISVTSFGCGDGAKDAIDKIKGLAHTGDERAETLPMQMAKAPEPRARVALTAAYTERPLDVLVVREHGAATQAFPFADRLALAVPTLLARLLYSGQDFRLAVTSAGAMQEGLSSAANATGEFITADGEAAVLVRTLAGFREAATRRLLAEVTSGHTYQPLAALAGVLERHGADTVGADFLRPGAYLAVIYVAASPSLTRDEEGGLTAAKLMAALDAQVGQGNYAVSALMPDQTGCKEENAAESKLPHAEATELQRLVAATKGVVASPCEAVWNPFFDRLIDDGTTYRHFQVALPQPAVAASMRIHVGDQEVHGWRYSAGSREILLPRLIPSGVRVVIDFEIDAASAAYAAAATSEDS